VRLLGTGVALLTLALAFGSVYWSRDTASVGSRQARGDGGRLGRRAVAFGLRVMGRLLARRFAWTCLALFAAALLSLEAVDRSRHPGAVQSSLRLEP
jgi:HemX protein